VTDKTSKKVIWADALSLSSMFYVLFKLKDFDRIYYLNSTKFTELVSVVLSWIKKAQFLQVTDIVESHEKLNNMSLYEAIQLELNQHISKLVDSQSIKKRLLKVNLSGQKVNQYKLREHIRERVYYHLYKPITMKLLSEKFGDKDFDDFLIRRSNFDDALNEIFSSKNIKFYPSFYFSGKFVKGRDNYFHDRRINSQYFSSNFYIFSKRFLIWILSCLFGWLYKTNDEDVKKDRIGVELLQDNFTPDGINDLYWIESSALANNIVGISYVNYSKDSLCLLKNSGVKSYKVAKISLENMFNKEMMINSSRHYFKKTFVYFLHMLPLLFRKDMESWVDIEVENFLSRLSFWTDAYNSMGICMVWSMLDIDSEKNIKSQAIEILGGIFAGSHWSNYPNYGVINQKCYDVFFAWSHHFSNHNVINSGTTIQVGYPSDHYFSRYRELIRTAKEASDLKGLFVISLHDNIVANDLPYSESMQLEIHLMLLSLLPKYKHVKILLKPKRADVFNKMNSLIPELDEYIKQGKVEVFFGGVNQKRALPAEIGLLSDLAIGLGISTPAAECCFAGVVSFHADLTGFYSNAFANKYENSFVFRDIKTLKKAVIKQILGEGRSLEECQMCHRDLDPFQDGLAHQRTGEKIRVMYQSLQIK